MNIYLDLTSRFNDGQLRAILAGGQAAVLHRIAFMSKDGDWILREDPSALDHVLQVLTAFEARYRYGAPLDVRWLAGGWSSHLEFRHQGLRIRTDFVTRPARLNQDCIARIWREAEGMEVPFVNPHDLAEMKKTNREKDYLVIGELARRMSAPEEQLLYSRSARDLVELSREYPDLARSLAARRPILATAARGIKALEPVLDAERRQLIRVNEERLARYMQAAEPWAAIWPELSRSAGELPLRQFHALMIERADGVLPPTVPGGWP